MISPRLILFSLTTIFVVFQNRKFQDCLNKYFVSSFNAMNALVFQCISCRTDYHNSAGTQASFQQVRNKHILVNSTLLIFWFATYFKQTRIIEFYGRLRGAAGKLSLWISQLYFLSFSAFEAIICLDCFWSLEIAWVWTETNFLFWDHYFAYEFIKINKVNQGEEMQLKTFPPKKDFPNLWLTWHGL